LLDPSETPKNDSKEGVATATDADGSASNAAVLRPSKARMPGIPALK
jgi:hypothetical protein